MASNEFGINLPTYNPTDTSKSISAAGALFDKAFSGIKDIADERNEFNAGIATADKEKSTQEGIAQIQGLTNFDTYDADVANIQSNLPKNVDLKAINEARNKQDTFIGTERLRKEQLQAAQNKNTLTTKELGNYDEDRKNLLERRSLELQVKKSSLSNNKKQGTLLQKKINRIDGNIQAKNFITNSFYDGLTTKEDMQKAGAAIDVVLSETGLEKGSEDYVAKFEAMLKTEKHRMSIDKYREIAKDPAQAKLFQENLAVGFLGKEFDTDLGYKEILIKAGLIDDPKGKGKDSSGLNLNQQLSQLRAENKLRASNYATEIKQNEAIVTTAQKDVNNMISPVNHDAKFIASLPKSEQSKWSGAAGTEGGSTPMADINLDLVSTMNDTIENINIYQNMLFSGKNKNAYKDLTTTGSLFSSEGLNRTEYIKQIKQMKASFNGKDPISVLTKKQGLLLEAQNELNTLRSNTPEPVTIEDLNNNISRIPKTKAKKGDVKDAITQAIEKRKGG